MHSPTHLATQLARAWQRADWREKHLLHAAGAWPLRMTIAAPSATQFRDDSAAVAQHLQAWRAIAAQGLGRVHWQARLYQAGAGPVELPVQWELPKPSDYLAAVRAGKAAESAGKRAVGAYKYGRNAGQVRRRDTGAGHRRLPRRAQSVLQPVRPNGVLGHESRHGSGSYHKSYDNNNYFH